MTQRLPQRAAALLLACALFAQSGTALATADPPQAAPPTANVSDAASAQAATIVEDYDKGYWFFEDAAQGVRIEIHRYEDKDDRNLWYEADLRFSPETPLRFYNANQESPGRGFYYPERLMMENHAVFGIIDDQFGNRMYNHQTVGVIIRNGQVLSDKTRKNGNRSWPTLDTAAFFADGTMQVFQSKEHTAAEYLAMGAKDVLSFGPYLLRDGEVNPLLAKNFRIREPRSAIGMIEPYHFIVLSVEGRTKQGRGVGVAWLAERMKELGATQAFNLDGGKTCCIVFMGKKLDINNPKGLVRNERSVSGMIGLGVSTEVPAYTGVEE
ncbi:MAG: phosphodiester glycosidase family protein [Clostridia bacterium]